MGDGLKITKDKRHRSSSSLSGAIVEGSRSERKLDIRASIPEVDDQFAIAEARCDNLQEKIDLVKVLKNKRRFKRRSMTRLNNQQPEPENIPLITVRTQPKNKVSQQATRLRRIDVPTNPIRGYLDPATVEQHRMIGQVRGYNQSFRQPQITEPVKVVQQQPSMSDQRAHPKRHKRRVRADGDATFGHGVHAHSRPTEIPGGENEIVAEYSDIDVFDQRPRDFAMKKPTEIPHAAKLTGQRRRHVPKNIPVTEESQWMEDTSEEVRDSRPMANSPVRRHGQPYLSKQEMRQIEEPEERPVVELFNKSRTNSKLDARRKLQSGSPADDKKHKRLNNVRQTHTFEDHSTGPLENKDVKKDFYVPHRNARRMKYRNRHYELPTVASQMKQAGMRCSYGTANQTNIPFVVSKSTAPSHNIGVNIQQVLNGLKIQQPLSGIPLTIAHHMGLGHIPTLGSKSATLQEPLLDNREINAIKLGDRLLRLPSYKYISYSRLLSLYREGEGVVPRFLRAMSRPHYFYTSMYNLTTNREDFDGATSKGRGGNHEAKQSLAEYASLYREYEQVDKSIKEGNYDPELERRWQELSKELTAREEYIRKVVQDYRTCDVDQSTLRASASTADDGCRQSAFKFNIGDTQQ